MDSFQYVLNILLAVFFYIVVIGIFMRVAAYIGEKIGFARLFQVVWQWIRRKIKSPENGRD